MTNVINRDNLASFAYTNGDICRQPIHGILLEFHGLGGGSGMIHEHSDFSRRCAEEGVLYVFPYYGPWSWMNDVAVRTVDEIVDALFDKWVLPPNTPVISSGGSMGGLSALVYARYARHRPAACAAVCPVCDLPYHYTERDDLPRTLYHAFGHYPGTLAEAMISASPLHQAAQLPDIPYLILHCTADEAVSKAEHSDRLVEAMRQAGRTITYVAVPGRGHCDLSPEAAAQYQQFLLSAAKGRQT